MKVNVVVKIARQVEGEYVFINPITAFVDPNKARNFVSSQVFQPAEVINNIECMIEIGILQNIEVEDIAEYFEGIK